MNNTKTLFHLMFGLFGLSLVLAGCGLYFQQQTMIDMPNSIPVELTTRDVVQSLLAEKYDVSTKDIAIIVEQETEEHMRGVVRYPDKQEAGTFLASMGLGEWELVYDGNDAPDCGALVARNFPESMIFDCKEYGSTKPVISAGTGELLVSNFDECVAAGNPILESYPEQCIHNGVTYRNEGAAPILEENLDPSL